MKLPSNVKVTSSVKRSNLWLRAALDKNNYARISVTRNGWRITAKGNMKIYAMMIKKQFKELLDANYTFGDAMEYLRLELGA